MRKESKVIGSNVRKYRKSAGWTQEKLAAKVNLSSDYISRLELGKENPTLDVLVRISKSLEFPLADLLSSAD